MRERTSPRLLRCDIHNKKVAWCSVCMVSMRCDEAEGSDYGKKDETTMASRCKAVVRSCGTSRYVPSMYVSTYLLRYLGTFDQEGSSCRLPRMHGPSQVPRCL